MAKASKKKKKVRVEAHGQAHIQATFNNIIISLTNNAGEVIELVGPQHANWMRVDPLDAFTEPVRLFHEVGHASLECEHEARQIAGALHMVCGVGGPLLD